MRSNNRASRRPGRSARIVLPSSQRSSSSNLTLENNIDLLISSRRIQHQQRNVAVASAAETVVPPQEPSTSPQTLTTTTQVQTAPLPLQSPNPVIVQEYNEDDADSGGFDDDDDEDTLYSPTPRHARSRSLNTNFQNTQSLSLSANTGLGSSHARHARSTTMRPSSSASFHYFHNTQARRPPRPRMVRPSLFLSAPRKTTSQLRLEKELADKEAKLRAELATKFRANPVPSTSLVPK